MGNKLSVSRLVQRAISFCEQPIRRLANQVIGQRRERFWLNRNTLSFETLEGRNLLSATPLITEFMASNATTLNDGDGETSDWIEIYNPTSSLVDLAGWHLTDDPTDLDRWEFPDSAQTKLNPGDFLVVFASGQINSDYVDAGGNLHTNFGLASGGEYLALVDPDGLTIAQEFAPGFPKQNVGNSFGLHLDATSSVLLADQSTANMFVPPSDALGSTWQTVGFDDSQWLSGTTPVGFDTDIADPGEGDQLYYETIVVEHSASASGDGTIHRGSPTARLGGNANLIVKNSSTASFQRKAYVGFDVAGIDLSILSDAKLNLGVTETDRAYTVNVYGVNEDADTWNESTLTWDNAPANDPNSGGGSPGAGGGATSDGTFLGQFSVTTSDVGDVIDFANADSATANALVEFIRTDTNGSVSFLLTRLESRNPNLLSFASKENSNSLLRPTLDLTTTESTPLGTDLGMQMMGVNATALNIFTYVLSAIKARWTEV